MNPVFKRSVAEGSAGHACGGCAEVAHKHQTLAAEPLPSGCPKLSAQERYRIRVGRYRVLYEIRDHELVVMVAKAAHRKDVYRH
ncbi:MAG: hypothetical protein CALGDGBN_02273 [Pseudomonadales bacterium]|nr:hypothetical protein [Pseudomonadales bacterium]